MDLKEQSSFVSERLFLIMLKRIFAAIEDLYPDYTEKDIGELLRTIAGWTEGNRGANPKEKAIGLSLYFGKYLRKRAGSNTAN